MSKKKKRSSRGTIWENPHEVRCEGGSSGDTIIETVHRMIYGVREGFQEIQYWRRSPERSVV